MFRDKARACKQISRVVFLSFSLSGTFWVSGAAPFGSHSPRAGTLTYFSTNFYDCIHIWGQVVGGWGEEEDAGFLAWRFPFFQGKPWRFPFKASFVAASAVNTTPVFLWGCRTRGQTIRGSCAFFPHFKSLSQPRLLQKSLLPWSNASRSQEVQAEVGARTIVL